MTELDRFDITTDTLASGQRRCDRSRCDIDIDDTGPETTYALVERARCWRPAVCTAFMRQDWQDGAEYPGICFRYHHSAIYVGCLCLECLPYFAVGGVPIPSVKGELAAFKIHASAEALIAEYDRLASLNDSELAAALEATMLETATLLDIPPEITIGPDDVMRFLGARRTM